LSGFEILNRGVSLAKFYGESMVIEKIKEYFNLKSFFKNFQDDYKLISKVGSGKYAKVKSVLIF
jgi:hypothetical protein